MSCNPVEVHRRFGVVLFRFEDEVTVSFIAGSLPEILFDGGRKLLRNVDEFLQGVKSKKIQLRAILNNTMRTSNPTNSEDVAT
jgi:hypothetical protein